MTTPPKTRKAKKMPSFGTLSLIETPDGDIRVAVDIEQNTGTSEELMDRIRATLCGLTYIYRKNEETIHGLGEAYIEGLETGIESMMKKDKDGGDNGPKIGFRANL